MSTNMLDMKMTSTMTSFAQYANLEVNGLAKCKISLGGCA